MVSNQNRLWEVNEIFVYLQLNKYPIYRMIKSVVHFIYNKLPYQVVVIKMI